MNPTQSYVSWGAILAGAAVATSISIVLLQFGTAIGLASVTDITPDTTISAWGVFAVGFWLLWVQLIASVLGGYLAGRLRTRISDATEQEVEIRDGAHGLLVWATGTLAVAASAAVVAALAAMAPGAADAATPATMITDTPEILAREKTLTVLYAFFAGATSFVSAVAAWFAATKGGDHRDNNVDSSDLSFRTH